MERLTTKQASEILGVSRRRVIALIEQKKLKAEKFGSVYSIAKQDVESVKKRTNGRPSNGTQEKPFKTIFDLAPNFVGFIDDDDLPVDLSSNKKYLEGLGTKVVEKASLKLRRKAKK